MPKHTSTSPGLGRGFPEPIKGLPVLVDFDGVLAENIWPSPELGHLRQQGADIVNYYYYKGYGVYVFTARPADHKPLIKEWLRRHLLDRKVYDVICDKPAGFLIDDRCWNPLGGSDSVGPGMPLRAVREGEGASSVTDREHGAPSAGLPEMPGGSEQQEILETFSRMLAAVTKDGAVKREQKQKPLWKVDTTHEPAIFSHVMKWKKGELKDKDSGAHPLVHAAWRCLAIAWQETEGE